MDSANNSAGDTFTYAAGNYGSDNFDLTGVAGATGNFITHQCATKYGCSFDRWVFQDTSYVEVIWMKSDSNFFDSTHTGTNPRVRMRNTHDVTFTAVFIRGQQDFEYNDVIEVGDNNPATDCGRCSWQIVFRSDDTLGATQLLETTHTILQIHNDDDGYSCRTEEIGYAVLGTTSTPVIVSTKYHHSVSNKGACSVLLQHIDFQQSGQGNGPLRIPNFDTGQGGETIHGSSHRHYAIRFNTLSLGGVGTHQGTQFHHGVGLFGGDPYVTEDVCIAHNSSWRPWGGEVGIGQLNTITNVSDISILNYAADEIHYGYSQTFDYVFDSGTHTGANNQTTTLTDSSQAWVDNEWNDQYIIYNVTDGSSAVIDDTTATTIVVTALTGGTDNDFDTGDSYEIRPRQDEGVGYALMRMGGADDVETYIDGFFFDIHSDLEGDKFIWDSSGDNAHASSACPDNSADGVGDTDFRCGSNISYSNTQFFADPANRDFTINTGDPAGLTGAAVPIATVSGTGSGQLISLNEDRGGCFMQPIGESGKGWPGDTLDINGEECTVSAVDYESATNTITCNETISYAEGEEIRFKIDGAVHDDIGAIAATATPPGPGPQTPGPQRSLGRVIYEGP
jgi:hypothetical protein